VYQTAFRIAEKLRDARSEARALMGMGGARMARFHYQDALEAYLRALNFADMVGDRLDAGAIQFNLSSLYHQIGDVESARRLSEAATQQIRGLPESYYLPQLLL